MSATIPRLVPRQDDDPAGPRPDANARLNAAAQAVLTSEPPDDLKIDVRGLLPQHARLVRFEAWQSDLRDRLQKLQAGRQGYLESLGVVARTGCYRLSCRVAKGRRHFRPHSEGRAVFLSGWLGLGTIEEPVVSEFSDPRPSFVPFSEFSGCNRAPVSFGPALTARIDRFPAPTAPAGAVITHGALYDSEGGVRYLLMWPWNPVLIAAGPETTFPPLEVVVAWTTPVQHLLNSSEHQDYPDKITIDRGREVGTWNNRPITAACKLAALGGTFVARAAATRRAAA